MYKCAFMHVRVWMSGCVCECVCVFSFVRLCIFICVYVQGHRESTELVAALPSTLPLDPLPSLLLSPSRSPHPLLLSPSHSPRSPSPSPSPLSLQLSLHL